MKDELNPKVYEHESTSEFVDINENITTLEQINVSENPKVEEFDGENPNKNIKKNKKLSIGTMSSSVIVVVAAAVVGITNMLNVNMSASFDSVTYADGTISYSVNVSNMTEKETLKTYIYEDEKFICEISLTDDDNDGIIEGTYDINLDNINDKNSTTKYRLSLSGNVGLDVERKFDSYVVKIDHVYSIFNEVTTRCCCAIDGTYKFKMDFIDDYKMFTNFIAYIETDSGEVVYCTFKENLHEEQSIYVLNLQENKGKLTIKYLSDGVEKTITMDVNF